MLLLLQISRMFKVHGPGEGFDRMESKEKSDSVTDVHN
jgi:hypothetical protein